VAHAENKYPRTKCCRLSRKKFLPTLSIFLPIYPLSGSKIIQTQTPTRKLLGENVEGLKKKLYEERFIFSMVIVVLFDAFFFKSMDNWGSSIAILLLEIVALLVLARRLNVSDLLVITSSIIQALRR
jgi:hypothetical protein